MSDRCESRTESPTARRVPIQCDGWLGHDGPHFGRYRFQGWPNPTMVDHSWGYEDWWNDIRPVDTPPMSAAPSVSAGPSLTNEAGESR